MNIFIGNLSYNVIGGDLRHAFEAYGQVTSATIIKDKQSGKSVGANRIFFSSGFDGNQAKSLPHLTLSWHTPYGLIV